MSPDRGRDVATLAVVLLLALVPLAPPRSRVSQYHLLGALAIAFLLAAMWDATLGFAAAALVVAVAVALRVKR